MSNLTLKEQLEALALSSSSTPTPTPAEKAKRPQQKQAKPSNNVKPKPAWLEHAQYGVELLKAHFPACFKEMQEIQPLKIGIKQDLVIRLGGIDTIVLNDKACMVNSLAYYVSSASYHRNMIAGATRIDLDGNPTSLVTEEEAQYSANCRQAKFQKKAKPVKKKELAETS